ncbi:hypothetical protein [Leptolyngbya sp. AN10]|uniref:hypothetical protein n=1 Tax=Leptolyngbya sp. AN10 TaxID=3423365 RepID=UPI003D31081F
MNATNDYFSNTLLELFALRDEMHPKLVIGTASLVHQIRPPARILITDLNS